MQLGIRIVEPDMELITPEDWLPGMARIIEYAGRKSHRSEGRISEDSAGPFIQKIAFKKGHESIIEHGFITVDARMSRTASHQWVRHRIAQYTQESQRFCSYAHPKWGNVLDVICPPTVTGLPMGALEGLCILASWGQESDDVTYRVEPPEPKEGTMGAALEVEGMKAYWHATDGDLSSQKFRRWCQAIIRSYGRYLELVENGVPAEDARFLLPNAARTEIVVTNNIRSWRHFFTMRCTKHAQWEIRHIAKKTLRLFIKKAPWGFDDEEMRPLAE